MSLLHGIIASSRRSSLSYPPMLLTGLKLWVRSDLGITLNGSDVSSWADQSGNGNDLVMASASEQPGYLTNQLNGHAVVEFDGIDEWLATATFSLVQPETIFLVLKQTTWTDDVSIMDGFATNSGRCRQVGTTPNIALYAGAAAAGNTDLTVNTYSLVTIIFNGGSSLIQVNNNTETTGNAGGSNMNGFTLGAIGVGGGPGGNFSNISVAEVIVQEANATTDERDSIKAYVTARYGI